MKIQKQPKQGYSAGRYWQQIGYSMLVLTLLLTNLVPVVPAAAQTGPQVTQKPNPKQETEPIPQPNANPPTRNVLTGNPITFSNSSSIIIQDDSAANPYPATINVQGMPTNNISGLTVSLYGLSHTYPADIDILLVGPTGQKTLLMSDTGGGNDIVNVNLTFDDNAANSVPANTITSGAYQPTNSGATDNFANPAPASPYSVTLSVFNNTNVNGDWKLYIMDDTGGDDGLISGGWNIVFYVNSGVIFPSGGNYQSAWRADTFASPLQATVKDNAGNPISNSVVTFTAPDSGASGTFAGNSNVYSGATDAQGVITAPLFKANSIVGSYDITATSDNVSNMTAYFRLSNEPGPPAAINISSGNHQAVLANAKYPQPLAVVVIDGNGALVSGAVVTFTAPTTGPSGVFGNGTTVYTGTSNSAGVVTATAFTSNAITGTFNVVATVERADAPVSFTLTNLPAARIRFASSSYSVSEDAVTGIVTLTRELSSAGAVTVSISASNLTASNSDYTLPALSGRPDTSFSPGSGPNSDVFTIRNLPNNKTLISGIFTAYDGIPRGRVARLNSDGTLDTSFDSGVGADGAIESSAVQPDGKILLVGAFITFNGVATGQIVRLKTDGSIDETFSSGGGANAAINEVALQPDGKILIGGDFTTYAGVGRNHLARINSDGSLDETFVVGTGLNNGVSGLGVQTTGKIVVAGSFSSYNNVQTARILQLNNDGSLDTTFGTNIGSGPNNAIAEILLQPDDKILLGGDFTTINGATRNRVARINSDGSLDTAFSPGTGPNLGQRTFALQPDGKILLGGDFTTYAGVDRGHVARINSDGSLDTTFDVGSGASNLVSAIAVQNDGKILVGGQFGVYDGINVTRLARLGGTTVSWADGDTSPKGFSFLITSDNLSENDEQFVLTLNNINNPYSLGSPLSTTVTIVDNDPVFTAHIGSGQSTLIQRTFGLPLVASIRNGANNPISGVTITFTAPTSGPSGTFAGGSTEFVDTTDASGLVTATVFTANALAGNYTVTAIASEVVSPVNFALANNALPTTTISVTSTPNPSVVGEDITFKAMVDPAGATGTVTFTIEGITVTGTLLNGTATYITNTLPIASYQITATYGGDNTYDGSQSAIYTHTVVKACDPLLVTAITDNGAASTCGTFSYALLSASSGTTVTFALTQSNQITFTGTLTPTVKPGVVIDGGANRIVLNGNGVSGDGLRLGGNNTLLNVTVKRFAGHEIVIPTGASSNRLLHVITTS